MTSLTNKVALLTGALGSLGQAQAEALAKAGATVILWDRPDRPEGEASPLRLRKSMAPWRAIRRR